MTENTSTEHTGRKGIRAKLHTVWISIEFLSVQFADAVERDFAIMRRESSLFLGLTLLLLGILNWSVGKYCDGNTGDYLSCTRPEAYYYYGAFQTGLIILGALLIAVWFMKNHSHGSK